jgi:hypothetical protein
MNLVLSIANSHPAITFPYQKSLTTYHLFAAVRHPPLSFGYPTRPKGTIEWPTAILLNVLYSQDPDSSPHVFGVLFFKGAFEAPSLISMQRLLDLLVEEGRRQTDV